MPEDSRVAQEVPQGDSPLLPHVEPATFGEEDSRMTRQPRKSLAGSAPLEGRLLTGS